MTFTEKKFRLMQTADGRDRSLEATLKIDTTKQPFEIDLSDLVNLPGEEPVPFRIMGIFQFEGDKLQIRLKGHVDGKDSHGKPFKRPTNLKRTEVNSYDKAIDAL